MNQAQWAMMYGDCPRCGAAKTTFDVTANSQIDFGSYPERFEIFVRCRRCIKSSIFSAVARGSSNGSIENLSGYYINEEYETRSLPPIIKNARTCPEHVPDAIVLLFNEATMCHSIDCFDAAGTMFRKVLDATTRNMIVGEPQTLDKSDTDYISWKTYKDLGLRLEWLFARERLPLSLRGLATCVHQDGNDAAHATAGIGKLEAADLEDFTVEFLEAIFTLPGRIAESEQRRLERRG